MQNNEMNAAVIGAGSESLYTIAKAQSLGFNVIALDGDANAPGLRAADESFVVDIRDHAQIFEVLDKYKPQVILPVPIGRYLTSSAAANDRYGLIGISEKAASICTDKYLFHKALSDRGLRNCEMYLVEAGVESVALDEINEIYPVVVKPRFGSGSRGVEIYNTPAELEKEFLSQLPFDEDYCIETLIAGDEYGVDGAYVNGEFKLILLRYKINTPPPFRQCVGYYSVMRTEETEDEFEKITTLLQQAGEAIGYENTLMHADIIMDDKGDPFIIETSGRPSGHNLHNLFTPLASGVDEVVEFIKMAVPELHQSYCFDNLSYVQTALTPAQEAQRDELSPMLIRYFDFEDCDIVEVPDFNKLMATLPIKAYACNLKPGMRLGKVTDGHSLMGRGFYVIKAESVNELDRISDEIRSEFKFL